MSVQPIPAGYHTVTPYLAVANVAELIDFMKTAFDATEKIKLQAPDGSVCHAEVAIGDSVIMLGVPKGDCEAIPGSFYLYVADVDAMYKRAVETGATSTMEPVDQFWGDRVAGVKDGFGNRWELATHIEDVSLEECERRLAAYFAK